jgi:hypothetical protein
MGVVVDLDMAISGEFFFPFTSIAQATNPKRMTAIIPTIFGKLMQRFPADF